VNEDGSGERDLGVGTLPTWTSDSRSVVVERLAGPGRNSTIHVYSADGRNRRMLTSGSGPAVSPDGSRIAFVRFTYRQSPNGDFIPTSTSLHTISVDGTGLRQLARTTVRNRRWIQPKWASDTLVSVIERTGAVAGSGPILTFSMSGQRRVVVPRVGETYDWSPSGDRLAYGLADQLIIARRDGTELDTYGNSSAIDIDWSPDGKKVAFSIPEVLETGQYVGLYTINLEEEERRRFVITDGFAAYLDYRPLVADEEN
jgi:Tol biopolymer transport system component